ncbi:MAG: hypothetical protein MI922_24930 [Bacteroidales bacterium]|nr:hypothetical protein [Bacteroidales bacterium]
MKKANKKQYKTWSIVFVTLIIGAVSYGQEVDKKYKDKLEEAKDKKGVVNKTGDKETIVINTKMIERFYNNYASIETISWKEIVSQNDFSEVKEMLADYQNNNTEIPSTPTKDAAGKQLVNLLTVLPEYEEFVHWNETKKTGMFFNPKLQ